jgi:hypothetical protein
MRRLSSLLIIGVSVRGREAVTGCSGRNGAQFIASPTAGTGVGGVVCGGVDVLLASWAGR